MNLIDESPEFFHDTSDFSACSGSTYSTNQYGECVICEAYSYPSSDPSGCSTDPCDAVRNYLSEQGKCVECPMEHRKDETGLGCIQD